MVPGPRLVPSERRFELLVAGVVGAGLLGTTAFVGSLVVAAMTATGALGAGTSLWVLLALLLTVLVTGVVAAGATAWLAWIALAQLRTAAVSSWRRLLWTGYQRARAFEERSLVGRLLRPARLFESEGDREGHLVAELKARYVAGELDEIDFEHELGRLLGGGTEVGRQVRREIEVTAADGGASGVETQVGEASPGAGSATDRARQDGVDRERARERGRE